ncbi:DDE_3 domain-containing protein [Trichonephila clavipes]|nr:DDE_3 domain-containing protein [Trichonephila clavipes]
MDENVRPHRALLINDFLESEDNCRMGWPARFPDLNPIENVLDALGKCISQPPSENHSGNENSVAELVEPIAKRNDKLRYFKDISKDQLMYAYLGRKPRNIYLMYMAAVGRVKQRQITFINIFYFKIVNNSKDLAVVGYFELLIFASNLTEKKIPINLVTNGFAPVLFLVSTSGRSAATYPPPLNELSIFAIERLNNDI